MCASGCLNPELAALFLALNTTTNTSTADHSEQPLPHPLAMTAAGREHDVGVTSGKATGSAKARIGRSATITLR